MGPRAVDHERVGPRQRARTGQAAAQATARGQLLGRGDEPQRNHDRAQQCQHEHDDGGHVGRRVAEPLAEDDDAVRGGGGRHPPTLDQPHEHDDDTHHRKSPERSLRRGDPAGERDVPGSHARTARSLSRARGRSRTTATQSNGTTISSSERHGVELSSGALKVACADAAALVRQIMMLTAASTASDPISGPQATRQRSGSPSSQSTRAGETPLRPGGAAASNTSNADASALGRPAPAQTAARSARSSARSA